MMNRRVVGESRTCRNNDRICLGGASRVERPVDGQLVGPPSRSRDRALVGGDDVGHRAGRDERCLQRANTGEVASVVGEDLHDAAIHRIGVVGDHGQGR